MLTLRFRRLRGDMIQVYNILSGLHGSNSSIQFIMTNITNIRGNKFKMQSARIHYNIRRHFFSVKVIAVWNSLPNDVVSIDLTNLLKNRLDKLWYNQDLTFNWNANITGIGSRSLKCT